MNFKSLMALFLVVSGCATKYVEPTTEDVANIKLLHKMPRTSYSTLYKYKEPYCSSDGDEQMIRIGRALNMWNQQGEVKVSANEKITMFLSTSASYAQSSNSSIRSSCSVSISFAPVKDHTYEIFQYTPTFGPCTTFVKDVTAKSQPADLELKNMTGICNKK